MNGRFSENPSFLNYVGLTLRLHDLIAMGKAESEEAEALRDQMDEPWKNMSGEEVARVNGLSADLYMLTDDEIYEKTEPDERSPGTLGIALLKAGPRGDWPAVLSLLRKGPTFLPKTMVAFLRGRAYLRLGHPQVALLFFDYAAKLDSRENNYRLFSLDTLRHLGRYDEALARAREYISAADASLSLVVHPASEVFRSTSSMDGEMAQTSYQELIALLDERLPKAGRMTAVDTATVAFGHLLRGACLQSIGRHEDALAAYDASLKIVPQAESAVIAKAMLVEQLRIGPFPPGAGTGSSESGAVNPSRQHRLLEVILAALSIEASLAAAA